MADLTVLDRLIFGRVEPRIYAFTTNTVPNYLKVGDTYRPVALRLREWRDHFPDLREEYQCAARVSDDVYFRDYSVHHFLEREKCRARLTLADLPSGQYYSREFFKDATAGDVDDAVRDIQRDFAGNTKKYRFYNAATRLPEPDRYERTEEYPPRPNQEDTIRRFRAAIDSGRTNLLMYAVMRFGKSFTAMCCAAEMDAGIVAVVSAKADVREEWKKTVESHVKFADYVFLTEANLSGNKHIIRQTLDAGKRAVVFLTLQDLRGELIKEKHREIFGNRIDLLIVDETHFGARAEKYGQALRAGGRQHSGDEDDFIEAADAEEQIKVLDARVRLHLSGTPYRILMGGEFSKEDIIAFYQFPDIVREQEAWIRENNAKDEKDQEEEWANPYYGFPQMIRFAFSPNESSRRKLHDLQKTGTSLAFSALLKPRSIRKADDGSHKQFVFEREILDFLSVIDGSKEDDALLGFLDYDKIKSGSMCRHIVCVLPYCASCDAMEALITDNAGKFKNLGNYTIINISGVDRPNAYSGPADIKRKIRECEDSGQRTLTLTVNRMLTGSTVEQWDTMLFLKDTASPQEYDQAIFRLQNQYIKTYTDSGGHVIKYNLKPQTLLVDFQPDRMFRMQEQKAQIYNVNADEAGNSRLKERITEELRVSPIVVMNSDKMELVQAADIMQEVSKYSSTRGVAEETAEIPVDLSLMDIDVIRDAIEQENELGSKAGFTMKAHEGEGDGAELEMPDGEAESGAERSGGQPPEASADAGGSREQKDPVKQFRSYYARILFFAFLTRDPVISLEDMIAGMDAPDNARIAGNLGVTKPVLESILENINKFILQNLDYKIQNLNALSHDETVAPVDRAAVAVRKFGKLGEAEVVTPKKICEDMIALIPDDGFASAIRDGHKILDIAGKAGEFALAAYERMKGLSCEEAAIKDSICTIPTSGITYEFTRMVYELLGLNVSNIAAGFTSYDLLKIKGGDNKPDYEKITALLTQAKPFEAITLYDAVEEGDEKVKFDIVVGNPPYQVSDGGAQASAKPIYQNFVGIAKAMTPMYMTMIMPTRWYAGGKGLDAFRNEMLDDTAIQELHDYLHPEEVFPGTNNRGGICYLMWNAQYDNRAEPVTVTTHEGEGKLSVSHRNLRFQDQDIFVRYSSAIDIVDKVISSDGFETISSYISPRKSFGLDGNFIKTTAFHKCSDSLTSPVKCYGKAKAVGYIERADIPSHEEWIDDWKVLMPYANNIGTELNDDNQNTFVVAPGSVCTETFLIAGTGLDLDEQSANNLSNYLRTRFARFLLSQAKISQHGTAKTYKFVPLQDFSRPWTDAELYAKYGLTEEEIAFIETTIKPME